MSEKPIILKAIVIGILCQFIINFLWAMFSFQFLVGILPDTGPINDKSIYGTILTDPRTIIITLLDLIVCAGLPGYITARIANKNFALHGAIIGLITCVWTIRATLSEVHYPLIFGLSLLLLGLATSTAGGWLRGIQIEKKIENS